MSVVGVPTLHPFVVTGCPRSGTHYLSEVLTRIGLVCRHEAVFGPHEREFRGMGGAHGDSSWLAVPFLGQLPADAVVLHQTRHPLDVVRSLLGIAFLEDVAPWRERLEALRASVRWRAREVLHEPLGLPESDLGPRPLSGFRRFVVAHAPEVFDEPTPAERALRLWVAWNRAASANAHGLDGYRRYRVEDLDGELVQAVLGDIGLPVTVEQAALALQTASRDTNSRRRVDVTWDELPRGAARDAAEELAAEYAYDTTRTLSP